MDRPGNVEGAASREENGPGRRRRRRRRQEHRERSKPRVPPRPGLPAYQRRAGSKFPLRAPAFSESEPNLAVRRRRRRRRRVHTGRGWRWVRGAGPVFCPWSGRRGDARSAARRRWG